MSSGAGDWQPCQASGRPASASAAPFGVGLTLRQLPRPPQLLWRARKAASPDSFSCA